MRLTPIAIRMAFAKNTMVFQRLNSRYCFAAVLEARLWLEIARLVRARWERRQHGIMSRDSEYEVQTLWSNEDVQSIEVHNYVY